MELDDEDALELLESIGQDEPGLAQLALSSLPNGRGFLVPGLLKLNIKIFSTKRGN